MKILIPSACHVDSFTANVAYTLRAMGHEVETGPERSWSKLNRWRQRFRYLKRDALARVLGGGDERDAKPYLERARVFRPDLVLALTTALSDETIAAFRAAGAGLVVAWWGDAPGNMRRRGLFSEAWDVIFLKDPDAVAAFRRCGLTAHLLHEAHNPDWHKPVGSTYNQNVSVVGNAYFYRQTLVARLMGDGVPIEFYGSEPPLWSRPEIVRVHSGTYVAGIDKSRVFHQSLASLNSTSLVERNSMNCRAFEIAGAAGLQLIERRDIIESCFDPGRELLVFDAYEELREHIRRAERDPRAARNVREQGRRRALAHHTYEHRLRDLLDICRTGP
ncbi:MAG: glycosyltransferase [Myxococcota bacterium]